MNGNEEKKNVPDINCNYSIKLLFEKHVQQSKASFGSVLKFISV